VTLSGAEALKVIAGFDQAPDASQWWSFAAVTALSGMLGWFTTPSLDPANPKKNSRHSYRNTNSVVSASKKNPHLCYS
jgi:hypothetical protein